MGTDAYEGEREKDGVGRRAEEGVTHPGPQAGSLGPGRGAAPVQRINKSGLN